MRLTQAMKVRNLIRRRRNKIFRCSAERRNLQFNRKIRS